MSFFIKNLFHGDTPFSSRHRNRPVVFPNHKPRGKRMGQMADLLRLGRFKIDALSVQKSRTPFVGLIKSAYKACQLRRLPRPVDKAVERGVEKRIKGA